MLKPFDPVSFSTTVGGVEITLETGKFANQAAGAVLVKTGNTVTLVTAATQAADGPRDFFPLTCNYQEMAYAAGRVPGNYFRREIGRPSEHETLVSRLMDRPIRPMFPKGFMDEVQVIATVLSADRTYAPDVTSIIGASAALHISELPFVGGPVVGARVAYINKELVLYPTYEQMKESELNLVFAATRDAVCMVEGAAQFLPEALIAEALEWGHEQVTPLFDLQDEMRKAVGKEKMVVTEPVKDADVVAFVQETIASDLDKALQVSEKMARKAAKSACKTKLKEAAKEKFAEQEDKLAQVGSVLGALEKSIVRERVQQQGIRIDGRDSKTVRPLSMEVGLLPQTHGSSLFKRGETSALAVATLGSTRDEQRYETLTGDETKRFMLHYNFPPYCVGEARFLRGPSRREIGHGALAEKALRPVMPTAEEFPFTMRVVSEVMESNGSSSMASVCGATMSLMDAGVPIKEPVAGIAMGLVKEGDDFIVLTDILGDEDALGDMDFKVAGTKDGITAIQMDIKITGIPYDVLRRALDQARDARLHILEHMTMVLEAPRAALSELAPQTETLHINPDKIRSVIGPGGKNIKAITAETEADIDIEDSGKIAIFAPTLESLKKAKEMIEYYDQTPQAAKNYLGTVKKILEIGALVEILPGVEGMLHISQLDMERIEKVTDVLQLGQEVWVKCIELEPNGRIRLSRKAWLMEEAGEEVNLDDFRRPSGGPRGGGDRRGGRPPRGGDRRPPRGGGNRR
ncbi:MAG: polyribonucleotide nucleotidyltransferase [Desulfovibrio sp.]